MYEVHLVENSLYQILSTKTSADNQIDVLLRFNPLPNNKVLDWSIFTAFAEDKSNMNQKLNFILGRVEKHCGKRRKCWLPAFSSFPTMFSKGFFPSVIKSPDYVVKG